MLHIRRLAAALILLPLAAGVAHPQALDQLRGMLPGTDLPEVASVAAAPAGAPALAMAPSVRSQGHTQTERQPQARVRLSEIRDQYWKRTDGIGSGAERIYLSAHFDLQGEAYVSVLGAGWESPYLYKLERGMDGYWEHHGVRYRIQLDVSIWRSRTNNIIEVYREGVNAPVYSSRIVDLLAKAFATGQPVRLGGKDYRLFYSCSVDASQSPAEPDRGRPAVLLAEDVGERGEHEFNNYIFPASGISRMSVSRYALSNGQTIGMKLSPDGETLQVYDLPD